MGGTGNQTQSPASSRSINPRSGAKIGTASQTGVQKSVSQPVDSSANDSAPLTSKSVPSLRLYWIMAILCCIGVTILGLAIAIWLLLFRDLPPITTHGSRETSEGPASEYVSSPPTLQTPEPMTTTTPGTPTSQTGTIPTTSATPSQTTQSSTPTRSTTTTRRPSTTTSVGPSSSRGPPILTWETCGVRHQEPNTKKYGANLSHRRASSKLEPAISYGRDANLHEYPWMAYTAYALRPVDTIISFHGCGGSILNSRFVLTAGHCCVRHVNPDGTFKR